MAARGHGAWVVALGLVGCLAAAGTAAADVADHVFHIEFITELRYGDPSDPNDLTYDLHVEVLTDATVSLIEFRTPVGDTCQIPRVDYQQSGDVETEWYYDDGAYMWVYERAFPSAQSLEEYGSGTYAFTIHYQGGGQAQTTVHFGKPCTGGAMEQLTQEPVLTYPAMGATVPSPVTFTWQACGEPAATGIWVELAPQVDDDDGEMMVWHAPGAVSSAPIALYPGKWELELAFDHFYHFANNGDGIPYGVRKVTTSEYQFTVRATTPGTIQIGEEVNGTIGAPREVDEYQFQATAGQSLVIDVDAVAIGSRLDSYIILLDPNGEEVGRDDDSGDLAGDFWIEFTLEARRWGNSGAPAHNCYVEAIALDSRLYFTVPQTGTYTVAIGSYDFIEEGEDGDWGPNAAYRLRLLQASQLPQIDPNTVQVTLLKPGGGAETLACNAYPVGASYELEVEDTKAALEARFPDGTYTVRADYGGGDIRERTFEVSGTWPDFPYVTKPMHDDDGVPAPVEVAWQAVTGANELSVDVWPAYADDEDAWEDDDLPPTTTSTTVPASAVMDGGRYTAGVWAGNYSEPANGIEVDKASETLVNFRVGLPFSACVDDSNGTGTEEGTEPYPYAAIQGGIDGVTNRGTVKLAQGTYAEHLTFSCTPATVQGGYLGGTAYPTAGNFADASRNGDPAANQTVIDGGGAARQIVCQDAMSKGSVVTGIKITNGGAIFRGGVVLRRVIAGSGG